MQIEALKNFSYARRRYRRGDVVPDVSSRDAELLVYAQAARLLPDGGIAIEVQPDEDISPRTGKQKRRYQRRDMQAQ